MDFLIRSVSTSDWDSIAAIFNHYVSKSFAAIHDQPIDESFFRSRHTKNPSYPFVVAEVRTQVVGFAYLAPFHPAPTMRHTAMITYFIHPQYVGRAIGAGFLERLLEVGIGSGITNFIAQVSSLNPGSIRFHLKHGFAECGRIGKVGVKFGESFDMVWLQKQPA